MVVKLQACNIVLLSDHENQVWYVKYIKHGTTLCCAHKSELLQFTHFIHFKNMEDIYTSVFIWSGSCSKARFSSYYFLPHAGVLGTRDVIMYFR